MGHAYGYIYTELDESNHFLDSVVKDSFIFTSLRVTNYISVALHTISNTYRYMPSSTLY